HAFAETVEILHLDQALGLQARRAVHLQDRILILDRIATEVIDTLDETALQRIGDVVLLVDNLGGLSLRHRHGDRGFLPFGFLFELVTCELFFAVFFLRDYWWLPVVES